MPDTPPADSSDRRFGVRWNTDLFSMPFSVLAISETGAPEDSRSRYWLGDAVLTKMAKLVSGSSQGDLERLAAAHYEKPLQVCLVMASDDLLKIVGKRHNHGWTKLRENALMVLKAVAQKDEAVAGHIYAGLARLTQTMPEDSVTRSAAKFCRQLVRHGSIPESYRPSHHRMRRPHSYRQPKPGSGEG